MRRFPGLLSGIVSIKPAEAAATFAFWREPETWAFHLSCAKRDSLLIGASVTCDVFCIPTTRCYDLFMMFAASAGVHIYSSQRPAWFWFQGR